MNYRLFRFFIVAVILVGFASAAVAQDIDVPLDVHRWVVLSYGKINANKVSFEDARMTVSVQKSAGPVVSKLAEPKMLTGFSIAAVFSGSKTVETTPFDEDSILRVGLVVVGDRTLSAFKRLFVADWIKKLFALAPDGVGLDRIQFFNISNRTDLLNQSRVHPNSDLINEKISGVVLKPGPIAMNIVLPIPISVAAVWLSVDGDDTKSSFSTVITNLTLKSK